MSIKLIAAHDRERGIGRGGQLPWALPEEMKWLSATTRRTTDPQHQNALVMGRTTYESLPATRRPLPGRLNVVVTSRAIQNSTAITATSLDIAVELASGAANVEDIFIFGGAQIYKQALEALIPDELLLTVVDDVFECDTFLTTLPSAYILKRSTEQTYGGVRVFHELYQRP